MYHKIIKHKTWIILVIWCMSVISCHPGFAQKADVDSIDTYLTDAANRGILEGSVLVSKDNKIIYQKSFGMANREFKIKNAANTKFRIASVSKTFTALLIMQLYQEGKLTLEDRISDHLPWYREDVGYSVSLHDLLRMNSGIPTYSSYYDFATDIAMLDVEPKKYIETYCSSPLTFQPGGTTYLYSNTNYYILGAIIEAVTGKSYEEALHEKILGPLKMTNSGYFENTGIYENMATGYQVDPTLARAAYFDQSSAWAAGGLYSTAEDLYLFHQGLYSDALLDKKYRDIMFHNPTPATTNYCSGWEAVEQNAVYKTGVLYGFRHVLYRGLSDRYSIIILNNTDNSNAQWLALGILHYLNVGDNPMVPAKQAISIVMIDAYNKGGITAAVNLFNSINSDPAKKEKYEINDTELLEVGQYLLKNDDLEGASQVFALISQNFPNSYYANFKAK